MVTDRRRRLAEVWRVYADMARPPVDVNDVDRWRDRVRHDAAERHLAEGAGLLDEFPGITAESVVRALMWDQAPGEIAALVEAEATARAGYTAALRNNERRAELRRQPRWDGSHADGIAAARAALPEPQEAS